MIPLPGLVIKEEAFTAQAAYDGKALQAALVGVAEMTVAPLLTRLVQGIHAAAGRYKATLVVVDFRQLEFMNSSCFKSFVAWLETLRNLPKEKQYVIQFRTDKGRRWQKKSLEALSCFAPDCVQLQEG